MIDDIVFEGIKFFELQLDSMSIQYPMVIIFGIESSTDIIPTEKISIL